jgi:serine/threonine protein kinase
VQIPDHLKTIREQLTQGRRTGSSTSVAGAEFRSFVHKEESYVKTLMKNSEKLGEGMFGVVVKVNHHILGKDVAVKIVDLKKWKEKDLNYQKHL